MAKTVKSILDKARYYIGTKENPADSNNVIFNTDYYGHPGIREHVMRGA